MKIAVVTLFPEIIAALHYGITGRAIKQKILDVTCWNPRAFTTDKHQSVDDKSYGGGPGMVMKVAPLKAALDAAKLALGANTPVIYLSPQGRLLRQENVADFAAQEKLILLAGRYEGIDERLLALAVDAEWSIGDYVLSGGELAACVLIDAITRLLSGALGSDDSAEQDSFSQGLLDHPHYTRPDEIMGHKVPAVLCHGDHNAIAKWRLQQALGRTFERRPELLEKRILTREEQSLLAEFLNRSAQYEK